MMARDTEIAGFYRALVMIGLLVGIVTAEDMMLNINVKKPVAIVSDKFLSITLDPVALFNGDLLSDVQRSTSMAKALAPAYVRLGGPRSNSYIFERGLYPQEAPSDPGYTFSETHWTHVHQWAEKSGLDVIACIAPHQSENGGNGGASRPTVWDPRNALDLISFSDHMGYNMSWQLGYECQTRCDATGTEFGRDVQRLRNMLDAFPRYAERGLLAGPDVVAFRTRQQQLYLQDYFAVAAASLAAVTWHPDFAGISLEAEGVSMHHDSLALDKDTFYRVAGRHILKKPLWIAESRPEECKRQFLGALVWARRLGNSAKLGVQVLMRQPDNSNLFRPTPDYWVSMLHKMLVGREVLDTRIAAGNRTHVYFYCQCTRPSSRYEKGSLTVFGINLTPTKIVASLKGLKPKVMHKYILLPGYDAPNRMFAETILLNNEPLSLVDGKEVPDVQPAISSAEKGVKLKLPSGGIGFWVLPGLKVKTCMGHEDETADKNLLRKINKRLEDLEAAEDIAEPEDEASHELVNPLDSVEERKLSPRLQQQQQLMGQKRGPVRRSSGSRQQQGRDDARDAEVEERKPRRPDGIRHDFDRLDKGVRRKDPHSVNLKKSPQSPSNGGSHMMFETSEEQDNTSSEEAASGRAVRGPRQLDSGEAIRAKLEEYKRRLAKHENRKRQRELAKEQQQQHVRDDQDSTLNKGMDTGKVIEALTLITKVESAMKGLEKESESETRAPSVATTLGSGDFTDVTAGLQRSSGASERVDDGLLDEVLNTEKSKRTSVPTKIEDQLKALYRLLSEEKERREGQSALRRRRDLDKRAVADDPFNLRYDTDGIYVRTRTKAEEAKERRLERLNELKQRLREKQELRREREEQKRAESRDSLENNFYGFQQREPLKDFPAGDLFLQTGAESVEAEGGAGAGVADYDYVSDTNEGDKKQEKYETWKEVRSKAYTDGRDEHEDTWLEEGEGMQMPKEFFENVKLQGFNTKENLKNHGELWEAESLQKAKEDEKRIEETGECTNQEVVTEKQLSEPEDRKAKEEAVKQLNNYYQTDPNEHYDFEELQRNQQHVHYQQQSAPTYQPQVVPVYQQQKKPTYQQQVAPTYQQQAAPAYQQQAAPAYQQQTVPTYQQQTVPTYQQQTLPTYAGQTPNTYTDPGRYYTNPSKHIQTVDTTYRRTKRHVNDLEDIFHLEMISQDDNNLRDCQCRVIRGDEDCKDCNLQPDRRSKIPWNIKPGQIIHKPMVNNYGKGIRFRRDVGEVEIKNENEETNAGDVDEEGDIEETIGSAARDKETEEASSEEHVEELEDAANGEISLEDSNEATEVEESTATHVEDPLKLENDDEKQLANRLPRKIEPLAKFFLISGRNVAPSTTKENPRKEKQENSSTTQNPSTTSRSTTVNEAQADGEHIANIRSVDGSPNQVPSTASPKITAKKPEKPVNQKEYLRAEHVTITSSSTNAKSGTTKSAGGDSDAAEKDKDNARDSNAERISEQSVDNPTTRALVLNNLTAAPNVVDAKSNNITTKSAKKTGTIVIETKNKPKSNNTLKLEDMLKHRHARLTTRSEALAALRKENESRRAKKMIEMSMKIIDNENARFAEYQKKRHEQLDRLKQKLRAKREKMLQQYREELLQAINESSDPKERKLRRRDLLEKYQNPNDDSRTNDMVAEPEKLAYIMRYKPIKYTTGYDSAEGERYVPVVEIIKPYRETRRRQILPRKQGRIYRDDNNNFETINDRTRNMRREKQFRDEEIYNAGNEEDFRTTNVKRSPYTLIDTSAMINSRDEKEPEDMEGDSGEYSIQEQIEKQHQPQVHEYYPPLVYDPDNVPLHLQYSQRPAHAQQQQQQRFANYYSPNPAYDQRQPSAPVFNINPANAHQLQNLNYYGTNRENEQQPSNTNNYYMKQENSQHQQQQEQEQQQQQQHQQQNSDVTNYQINPANYQGTAQAPITQNNGKSKRSSLKMLELDPSMYEAEEPEYDLQELFMRPTARFSSRFYRHDPYSYSYARYRRQADFNEGESLNKPLSFSLGLEKSKMKRKKVENIALPVDLVRRKRISDSLSETNLQNKTPLNKNIKKVYKINSNNKYKFPSIRPTYINPSKATSESPVYATTEQICKITEAPNDIPIKVKTFDLDNHLDETKTGPLLTRRRRSSEASYDNGHQVITGNSINRSEDPEMDEIWNNIIEMKQDEELLKEYSLQKDKIIKNFRDTQRNIQKYLQTSSTPAPPGVTSDGNTTTLKVTESTTRANIESMLVDAIPKLQSVITGGLEKAQNLTGSLEDFIENFDEEFSDDTTESSKEDGEPAGAAAEANDGRLSHNVFRHMVGSVKKFFGLVSGLAKVFHSR